MTPDPQDRRVNASPAPALSSSSAVPVAASGSVDAHQNARLNETHAMADLRARGGLVVRHIEARRRRWIVDAVLSRAPARVADVGCEDGWIAEAYAPRVQETYLVDLDPRMLEGTRLAARPGVTLVADDATSGDVLARTLGGRRVDVVLLAALLEHLADPAAALRALRPLVARGGAFVVYVPADGPILFLKRVLRVTRLGGLVRGLSLDPAPGHVQRFRRRDLVRLLAPFGTLVRLDFDPVCLGYLAVVEVKAPATAPDRRRRGD